jgi:NhaP-type Na+/H+ or K+/H+ antiporter
LLIASGCSRCQIHSSSASGNGEGLRLLAELTLAMVLFTDAANADFSIVKRNLGLPERLLLIGLPLTIVLGFLVAAVVFPRLEVLEMALLGAMLAPTDAALGKPVVTNPTVPAAMREALNLESGLNDGTCVPIVVLLLGLAVGTQIEGGTVAHVARVVIEAIGIGLITGLVLTWLTTLMLRFAQGRGWIGEHWVEIPIVALAAACFSAAQALGGSGFIACFVGGLLLSGLGARHKEELLRGAEHMGEGAGADDMGHLRRDCGRPHDRPSNLVRVALCATEPDRNPDAARLSVFDRHPNECC